MAKKKQREDKYKTHRLFQLLEFIRNTKYPNAKDFKKEFEVSRSTIMRDLDFLKDRYFAPIEYSNQHKGYYLTDPTFVIKSVLLTEGELFAVHTILPLMEQYKNTPLESTFKSIISKMLEMLPNKVEVDSSMNRNNIHFIKDPLPNIDELIFNNIFDAIKTNQSVEFYYRSISKQTYTLRKFDPYRVLCQKGNWYVIGYCHLHNRFNVYCLSRMKDLIITNGKFEVKKDFDINKHIDPDFGIWNTDENPQKIELLFDKSINTYILERTWHVNQECYQNEDGSVYLSFMSNQIPETLHWVMTFGSHVKVLNPPELKEKIKAEIKEMKKIY
ncbi:MAG: YafY family transcriptional regulator [Spirochaetaceae bacterium]|nr:YafY family transcriptional regulator [Spirochaetaceae bacterium]